MKSKSKVKHELSKNIVNYLHDTFGENYRQIGEKIDLSESFMSLVRHGERNLTLDHLLRIESVYETPLPTILIQAIKDKNIPEELREGYELLREIVMEI